MKNRIAIATTLILSLAALVAATFDFEGEKNGSDTKPEKNGSETKPGKIMNLEGGVGADFLGGGVTTGAVYYTTLKLTDDRFSSPIVGNLVQGKNRVFALGPELTMAIARKKKVYGSVTARYFRELFAETTTQGGTFYLTVTMLGKPTTAP